MKQTMQQLSQLFHLIFCTVILFVITFIFRTYQRYQYPIEYNNVIMLHISTGHPGVVRDVNQIGAALRIPIYDTCLTCHLSYLIPSDYSNISYRLAAELWQSKAQFYCNNFSLLIISDTIPQVRPFLQSNCSSKIILRITNRFDWMLFHDQEFHRLIQSSVNHPNVWIVPNNYFEEYYARTYRNVSLFSQRYFVLPSFLQVSPSIVESKFNPIPIVINHHHDRFFLIPFLQEEKIPHEVLVPRQYGGPTALTNRVILHLPYQASIMSLYENWQQGVIYRIPTMRLFVEQVLPFRACCLPPDVFQLQDAFHWLPYTDWYHPSYQELFVYFDNFEELKTPLSEGFVNRHRERMNQFIHQKGKQILKSWKFILTSNLG